MEPEKNFPEAGTPGGPEKKEERRSPLSVKAVFWITIVLLVAAVVLMIVMIMGYVDKVAGLFVLLMFIFAILNKACWKCPACHKHLGRFGYPKVCPHCGEDLKM